MSIDKAEFRKQLLNADGKPLWARDEGWERHDKLTGKHGQSLDSLSGEVKRGEVSTFGFHHIAYVCRNMKETINFYESALGMKCRAIYPMHGVPGAKHCFLDCGNGCELSFIEFSEPVEGIPGVSYPPKNNMPSPIGTHHHMAFRARSLTHLHNLRDQVRKQGLFASKVIHHGFICSFYFTDPCMLFLFFLRLLIIVICFAHSLYN